MAKDTVTLRLRGDEIPLHLFAKAVSHFSALIEALSEDVVGPNKIEWEIVRLEGGSAVLSVKGINAETLEIERAVEAYVEAAQEFEQGQPITYPDAVYHHLLGITSVLNGKVTSTDFETDHATVAIQTPTHDVTDVDTTEVAPIEDKDYSFGVLTGRITTIWSAPLKVALRDVTTGNATAAPTQPQVQAATEPTPATQQEAVPASVELGVGSTAETAGLRITLNDVRRDTEGAFGKANAGTVYLVLDLTFENTSDKETTVSSLISGSVRDDTGQKYNLSFTAKTKAAPDGTIPAGGKSKGEVAYEVPESATGLTYTFDPVFGGDAVQFKLDK